MSGSPRLGLKSKLLLIAVLVIAIFIPFQFWRSVWFGQELRDEQIEAALSGGSPRSLQHALAVLEDRIRERGPAVRDWYPGIAAQAEHPLAEIRLMAAWVMGQDNREPLFHRALARLVDDPEPMVRRNAALALTRFSDAGALPVLREMLQPQQVASPSAGTVSDLIGDGELVSRGSRIALLAGPEEQRIASPLPGRVLELHVQPGDRVGAGEPLLTLAPDPEHVWEALRALVLIGGEDEVPLVERVLEEARYSSQIREQARRSLEALRRRDQ